MCQELKGVLGRVLWWLEPLLISALNWYCGRVRIETTVSEDHSLSGAKRQAEDMTSQVVRYSPASFKLAIPSGVTNTAMGARSSE